MFNHECYSAKPNLKKPPAPGTDSRTPFHDSLDQVSPFHICCRLQFTIQVPNMDNTPTTYTRCPIIYSRGFQGSLCAVHRILLSSNSLLMIKRTTTDTEIDWKAYMEQVIQYIGGERDYAAIKGGTGPLVYPAGHVYIYSFLYHLTVNGTNILHAQWIFVGLYLATLYVVLMCYREARVITSQSMVNTAPSLIGWKAPPYILPLLLFSKRLHSIYMLRLFNDPFSIFFLFVAVYLWQKRMWTLGSISYSMSISVKMNTLFVLPAVGAILLQAVGRDKAVQQAMIMVQVQVITLYMSSHSH
jgi:hypothetical protein